MYIIKLIELSSTISNKIFYLDIYSSEPSYLYLASKESVYSYSIHSNQSTRLAATFKYGRCASRPLCMVNEVIPYWETKRNYIKVMFLGSFSNHIILKWVAPCVVNLAATDHYRFGYTEK